MDGIDPAATRRARFQIARRRGAVVGLVLVALGAWGALVPFVGPYFSYAYTPDSAWRWTASRGWLEVVPGVVTALGGALVLTSGRRVSALLGAWLAVAAGGWFVLGTVFEPVLHTGNVGRPAGSHATLRLVETLGLFSGLGVLIVLVAATALGRLSVRSLADIHLAQHQLDEELGARIRGRNSHSAADGDSNPTNDAQRTRARRPRRAGSYDPADDASPTRADPLSEPASAATSTPSTPGSEYDRSGTIAPVRADGTTRAPLRARQSSRRLGDKDER